MIPQSGPETSASPLAGILEPDSLGNPHLTLGMGDRRMTSPSCMSSVLFLRLVLGTLCLELSVEHGEAQGDHIVSGVEEKLWRMGTP